MIFLAYLKKGVNFEMVTHGPCWHWLGYNWAPEALLLLLLPPPPPPPFPPSPPPTSPPAP